MEIGERLHYWRTTKNMSVYKLSKLSGVSDNHIRSLENGTKTPKLPTLEVLVNALNISLSEFFNVPNSAVTYLSEGEKCILSLYRKLPKDKADILIDFYKKMCEANLPDSEL